MFRLSKSIFVYLFCTQLTLNPSLWAHSLDQPTPPAEPTTAASEPVPCEARLTELFGTRVRTRDNEHNHIIFSPKGTAKHTNNSNGFKISNLDAEELKAVLKNLMAESRGADLEGDLSATGLAMYSSESRELMQSIHDTLAELGLEAKLRVVPMYQPKGRGLRVALAKLRALLPMRQDYERPVAAELGLGTPGTIAAELTTVGYSVVNFPLEIAVPLSVSHFGLLGTLAAFSRTQINWLNRSRSEWEKLTKDFLIANVFIINYDVNSQWPKIYKSFADHGLMNPDLLPALGSYAANQGGVTAVEQTLFFYTTFVNGLWRWQAIMTRKGDPALTDAARNTGTALQPMIFAVSGPVLNWAATSHTTLFSLGSIGINPGQVALGGLTLAGCAIAANPERVLTPLIGPVNESIYNPITQFWTTKVQPGWQEFKSLLRGMVYTGPEEHK